MHSFLRQNKRVRKMRKGKKIFVLNDERKTNSYGFRILTSGISLSRFEKNPVMLDSHYNSNSSVIGKWEEVQKDNYLLTASPVFDTDDEKANTIAGKVERNFIKSCSMGVGFSKKDLEYKDGELVLKSCELYEVSIVAIPSNANAIRLYAKETGELMSDDQVQSLCLSLQANQANNHKNEDMKIKLSLAAAKALNLGDTTEIEADALNAKIEALELARKTAADELANIKAKDEQKALAAIELKVSDAIKAGKITADKKEEFVNLGVANPALLDTTLNAIPAKRDFGSNVNNSNPIEVKTREDFQKLSLQEQLAFKAEHPSEYVKLFKR